MRVKRPPLMVWLVLALGVGAVVLGGFRPGTLPYTPGAVFSDAVTSHLPAADFLRRSVLEAGTFPLWRETLMAGQPFAANPLNKTAYPLQWLVLVLPPVFHLDLLIILHLLLGGTGMWVWARSLGLSEAAAAFSALAYALAPRVIGHTGAGHLDLLYALAWFPWLIWAVRRLIYREQPRAAVLAAALFGALILLADIRLSFFAYSLAGAYTLVEVGRLRHWRVLLRFVPVLLLVALLTLSVTVPLFGWRPYLSRASLTPADAGVFSLAPGQFLGLLLPPQGGNIETLTALGLSVFLLAVIGAVSARQRFWVLAIAVAALYALGVNAPFWSLLVQVVPTLLWFRVPSRAWFVIALLVPLLAGYGVEWLQTHHLRRGRLLAFALVLVAALVGGFLVFSVPAVNGVAVVVGGVGFAVICLFAFSRRLAGDRLALALLLLVAVELTLIGRGWLEWRTETAWLPPEQVQLAERLRELDAYRVYSPSYSLQQQVAEAYDLRLFGGVDPFQLSGIVAAVGQGSGVQSAGYSVVLPPLVGVVGDDLATANRDAVPDTALLGRWGVTHVVSAYPLEHPGLQFVEAVAGMNIYANRDPALTVEFPESPAWVYDGAVLPSRQTVAVLNYWTGLAALVSGVSFIVLVVAATKVRD